MLAMRAAHARLYSREITGMLSIISFRLRDYEATALAASVYYYRAGPLEADARRGQDTFTPLTARESRREKVRLYAEMGLPSATSYIARDIDAWLRCYIYAISPLISHAEAVDRFCFSRAEQFCHTLTFIFISRAPWAKHNFVIISLLPLYYATGLKSLARPRREVLPAEASHSGRLLSRKRGSMPTSLSHYAREMPIDFTALTRRGRDADYDAQGHRGDAFHEMAR